MHLIYCAEPKLCNVALYRPAYQINAPSELHGTHPAGLANDGSRINSPQAGSCAVTGPAENPWWAVDLGIEMKVNFVLLTGCKL